jgi:hypothetical protein
MRENGGAWGREEPDLPDPNARIVGVEALAAEVVRLTADLEAKLERLRREEWYDSRSAEDAAELGEDRQVGMEPNPIHPTDPEGQ